MARTYSTGLEGTIMEDVSTRPLILVVEDDEQIAYLLKEVLGDNGYYVLVARSVDEAFTQLQTTRPALVTLDINLPGISGCTLLKSMRSNVLQQHTPVIIASSRPDIDPETQSLAQGVLQKPFELDALVEMIAQVIHAAEGEAFIGRHIPVSSGGASWRKIGAS